MSGQNKKTLSTYLLRSVKGKKKKKIDVRHFEKWEFNYLSINGEGRIYIYNSLETVSLIPFKLVHNDLIVMNQDNNLF